MSNCKTCGVTINGGTEPKKCGRCLLVETHLPGYLKNLAGRKHVALALAEESLQPDTHEDTPQDDPEG